jgi:hypothetical protein
MVFNSTGTICCFFCSFFSMKISKEMSAEQKSEKSANSVVTDSSVLSQKRTVLKDFSTRKSVFYLFLLCRITTEAMGIGGLRADFLS